MIKDFYLTLFFHNSKVPVSQFLFTLSAKDLSPETSEFAMGSALEHSYSTLPGFTGMFLLE